MEAKDVHTKNLNEVLQELKGDAKQGLSSDETAKRLERFGLNPLQTKKKDQPGRNFSFSIQKPFCDWPLHQDFPCISGEYFDGSAIGMVIMINTVIGFIKKTKIIV